MRDTDWTPSIVPGDDDRDTCLVVNDFGRRGRAWCETDVEATDLETVIQDLLDGQFSEPVRVVSFNTGEGWSRDISASVAEELRRRCELEAREVPPSLAAFSRGTKPFRASSRFAWSRANIAPLIVCSPARPESERRVPISPAHGLTADSRTSITVCQSSRSSMLRGSASM